MYSGLHCAPLCIFLNTNIMYNFMYRIFIAHLTTWSNGASWKNIMDMLGCSKC